MNNKTPFDICDCVFFPKCVNNTETNHLKIPLKHGLKHLP